MIKSNGIGKNIDLIGGDYMAKKVTGRVQLTGNRRSHSLRATKHAQKTNLQIMTLEDGTKIRTTTREMRTLRKLTKKQEAE